MKTVTIPVDLLLHAIFQDEEEIVNSPMILSWPYADFKPLKVRVELGALLQELQEEHEDGIDIHVDLHSNHAQIMRGWQWRESNERVARKKEESTEYREASLHRQNKVKELCQALSKVSGFNLDQCIAGAQKIYESNNVVAAAAIGVKL